MAREFQRKTFILIVILTYTFVALGSGQILADLGPVKDFQVGYLGCRLVRRSIHKASPSERWLAYYVQALSDATW